MEQEIIGFFTSLWNSLPLIRFFDVVDIAIVSVIIYKAWGFIFRTHYQRFAVAGLLIVLIMLGANLLNLPVISYFFNKGLELGLIALVILFQPELRRVLERIGSGGVFTGTAKSMGVDDAITQTALAYRQLSESKTGALIVFERSTSLTEFTNTGTILNADITGELIRNIFFEPAPLHDGAVIVREGKIIAAGCMLPLSKNNTLSHDLGMRHRAAIGMSEASDAVVAVVSEETGAISVAINGMMKRHLDIETFETILRTELIQSAEEMVKPLDRIAGRILGALKVKKHE